MNTDRKENCWEYKKCGREPAGSNKESMGICKAALEENLNGIHGGINGGRSCWAIAGTLCGSEVQGSFAAKLEECNNCDFYQKVKGIT